MMEKEKNKVEFEQIIERGCGIDIHKKVLVATIRGTGIKEETRSFDGFTGSIEEMRDWLKENGITHVAMESTGVYWKPVYNIPQENDGHTRLPVVLVYNISIRYQIRLL